MPVFFRIDQLLNLAILISGRGSNMESILKSIKKEKIPINPAVVISNNADAKGLKIAEKLGIKTEIVESKGYKGSRWKYDQKIIKTLSQKNITDPEAKAIKKHVLDALSRISNSFVDNKVTVNDSIKRTKTGFIFLLIASLLQSILLFF